MSVAIVTKYLGPTNYRGSRIVASVPCRIADCRPLGTGELFGGALPDGYAWVFGPERDA